MPKRLEIPDIPIMPTEKRTNDWVHSTHTSESVRPRLNEIKHDIDRLSPKINLGHSLFKKDSRAPGQSFAVQSTPLQSTPIQLIETLTSANQQMVTGLARQSLPKCHPDTFKGDATLFHPWKKAFKAMIRDADVSAEQEINYLRSFTSGEVQRVVDNFRKRQQNEPVVLLQSLWKELEKHFGSAAVITNALLERLHESAAFGASNNVKLQEFADLCVDVSSQLDYLPGLACLNYPAAIRPIVGKLPVSLRTKWEKEVVKYAERNQDAYPSFRNFAQVVENEATHKNHPNIIAGNALTPPIPPRRKEKSDERRILLTNTQPDEKGLPQTTQPKGKRRCPYHERDGHGLTECKAFETKSLKEKTEWIQKAGLCFRCLSETHRARDCKANTSCSICGDARHIALLHRDKDKEVTSPKDEAPEDITNKCTAVCGESGGGVSCSKVVLVDIFDKTKPHTTRRVYAILDDQSNSSLISSGLADTLGADGPEEKYYLSTCGGDRETKYGRRVTGLVARSALNGRMSDLPTLVECDHIPEDVREIPTPEVARRFPHLEEIANEIPPFDKDAGIHILLGRDAPELLKVRAFKNGPRGSPWAQKLSLGWTVTGQVCLDLLDGPVHIQARKTSVKVDSDTKWLTNSVHAARENEEAACVKINGEEYDVMPCPNKLKITDSFNDHDVFHSTPSDNEVSLSCDDRKFLEIMENEIHKNASGNWEMPLPFRRGNAVMPNNRVQAVNRLNSLLKTLKRKPQMEKDYLEFMQKVIDKSHASSVPPEEIQAQSGRVWYLPHFGVYHPKKPTQIRVVFDSSAEFRGVSLNKELLAGPDLMNSLLGVLIRFRKENVAVMCDIEQMFHSFYVNPSHRDYLRFLWYQDNDPQKSVTEYVHLFGNGPSPAVATFGLRKTAAQGEEKYGEEVNRNFYVDDGLASLPTVQQAVDLVSNAQSVLATSNLRLHKVVSNSIEVMEAFPATDRAKDVRDLDLRRDSLPAQRSLGVYWNLEKDAFTFRVSLPEKPFTRRGVLSIVNSVYDPLGMAVPVMLEGKKLLQQLVVMGKRTSDNTPLAWDDPLPEKMMHRWQCWKDSLQEIEQVSVPRCYHPKEFGSIARAEIHAFSDASQDAIGASVYLRLYNDANEVTLSFVYGQAKLAPVHPTSIPRLELCGAVLVAEAVQRVLKEIDMEIAQVTYYTDSKVVLGYITNESRRFYVYVANRVQLIRSVSSPDQWKYVESERNPADQATRSIQSNKLMESGWLSGPDFLTNAESIPLQTEIVAPSENDPEVRKEIVTSKIKIDSCQPQELETERFERFSSFTSLRRAIASLIVKVREFKERRNKSRTGMKSKSGTPKVHNRLRHPTVEELAQATTVIVKAIQRKAFDDELQKQKLVSPRQELGQRKHIVARKKSLKGSRLYRLDPFGGHRAIAKEINQCVPCKKLRGPPLEQRMADLPADRTEVGPPFTNVGFDVFGPWTIQTRKTRGGTANSKRWGLVFTCLSSRAIHIEVLESMDASAFICALRRFFALRGPATILRCDRGTNFVGGKTELDEALKEMDHNKIERFVTEQGCEWRFNPPHASHFGGAWERQIGTIRRVLDAMFAELRKEQLTNELLVTLMAEVTAIVNARPIAALPSDVDDPLPLSPAMLLTMKTRPLGPPPGDFLPADMYARRRWKRVQYLADQFWLRWRREYIQTLQTRAKWTRPKRNLVDGDVVLVKEEGEYRNDWPMGRVTTAIKSDDDKVRKATIVVIRDGKKKTMLRPIKELVLLIPAQTGNTCNIQEQEEIDSKNNK